MTRMYSPSSFHLWSLPIVFMWMPNQAGKFSCGKSNSSVYGVRQVLLPRAPDEWCSDLNLNGVSVDFYASHGYPSQTPCSIMVLKSVPSIRAHQAKGLLLISLSYHLIWGCVSWTLRYREGQGCQLITIYLVVSGVKWGQGSQDRPGKPKHVVSVNWNVWWRTCL